jgi:hypothetical protein
VKVRNSGVVDDFRGGDPAEIDPERAREWMIGPRAVRFLGGEDGDDGEAHHVVGEGFGCWVPDLRGVRS